MALLVQQWYIPLVLLKGKGQGRLEQPGAINPTGLLGRGAGFPLAGKVLQPGSRRRQQSRYQRPHHTHQ